MQSLLPNVDRPADCYLQIRRGNQTIFADVMETTTVSELKQLLGNILHISPDIIRLAMKAKLLDIDSKHLLEYGVTTHQARPQTPFPLEFLVQRDDGSYETEEIVSYSKNANGEDQ